MKIVIIHGQSHKGSTYNVANILAEKIGGEKREFFLPRDFGEFCAGCSTCFIRNESMCPHYDRLRPITEALVWADVIILASPVYVCHATGPMKALLDHYGYMWMVHRPMEIMFNKQAVCISTAAGGGMKSTCKDMTDSTFFWGIPRTYKYGVAVAAVNWEGVSQKKKDAVDRRTTGIADRIKKNYGNVRVGIKTKGIFHIMRLIQKKGWNESDIKYWKERGWCDKERPWRRK